MTTLNHARPYLKFVDNLTREINLDRSNNLKKEPKTSTSKMKTIGLNQLSSVALTNEEWELLSKLFENISVYYSICIEMTDSIFKNKKYAKLKQKQSECYEALVQVAIHLILLDQVEKRRGRERGLSSFIDKLMIILKKTDQHDLWCLLTEHIFKDALKGLASKLSAMNASQPF